MIKQSFKEYTHSTFSTFQVFHTPHFFTLRTPRNPPNPKDDDANFEEVEMLMNDCQGSVMNYVLRANMYLES